MKLLALTFVLSLAVVLGCGGNAKPDPKKIATDKSIPNKEALKKIAEGVFHLEKVALSEDDDGIWADISAFGMDMASVPDVGNDPAELAARAKKIHVARLAKDCKEYISYCRDRGLSGITVSLKVSGFMGKQKTWLEMFKINVKAQKFDAFVSKASSHRLLDSPDELKNVWEVEADGFDSYTYESKKDK